MPQVFKRAGIEAAKIASRSAEMDAAARLVLSKARIVAAQHRQTGAYMSKLSISEVKGRNGTRDRLVSANDPAATSIEFGHYAFRIVRHTKSRRATTGTITGKAQERVPGQFIMTKARGLL